MNSATRRNPTSRTHLVFEALESRQLLAADVVINEFVASNNSSLIDGFGESSDWVELYNRGDQIADLTDFHLTDDAADLSKWTFPAGVSLAVDDYLIVFASGRMLTTPDPGGFLHANFKLAAGGDYLALTDSTSPDPNVISEFGLGGQDYPTQHADISYGFSNDSSDESLVGPAHPLTVHTPTTGVLGQTWTGAPAHEPFDDSLAAGWDAGMFGVGYDTGPFSVQETVGNEVTDRDVTDTASGSIFSLTSSPFTNSGPVVSWSMYSNEAGRQITPLLLQRDLAGNFAIRGIGTTRTSSGGGEQTFDFGLQSGSDVVEETFFFGWKDGGNGTNNLGVADFTNGANEEVDWFQTHTSFAVGEQLGMGQSFPRAYSFQVFVEARMFDAEINTLVAPGTTTAYLRSKFNVDLSNPYDSLKLRMKYDDGIVVYLNGSLVFDNFAPSNPTYASTATGSRDDELAIEFQVEMISGFLNLLQDGENVLAVQILNSGAGSSDLLAVVELDGGYTTSQPIGYMLTPTPGAANVAGVEGFVQDTTFSVDRGFYDSPLDVEIASATLGATLVYTTDGTFPTLTNGVLVFAGNGLAPNVTVPVSTTTTLRAAAYKSRFEPTNVDTHTYLFIDDVVQQDGLFTNVTQNPIWGPLLDDSLLSVPTISIVTPHTISQVEKETSVELLMPDGSSGFQIDAGVEHFGGHSLNSPKKSMRLSFKSIYGDSKLNFDLYDDPLATNEFDQILLRTGSHDTWFWTHPAGQSGVYFRNRWAFERQLEMGHVAPHGRFVQVYINGKYEGLHNLMERPNDSFMASYLGGNKEDYDALNAGNAIDGDMGAWNAMVAAIQAEDWNALQQTMDVDNYIDYMLLEFYSGNDWDWNHSQNWAAATDRTGGDGYKFFAWDSDVKMRTTPDANVVNRGGPANLWGAISQIPEFRLLFADHVQKHFFHDGLFTRDQVLSQINDLAGETALPVIAETARWSSGYTPNSWQGYVDWIRDSFVPNRTSTVLSQLTDFLPSIGAPAFLVNGLPQHGGNVPVAAPLSMTATSGLVYFTTDGSDPRDPLGQPAGILFQSPIAINVPTTVQARVLSRGEWSALSEATFVPGQLADLSNLRITEINYNPYDAKTPLELAIADVDDDDFEFIEIVNTHPTDTLSLAGAQIADAVQFEFGDLFLQAGERAVVVERGDAFEARYGTSVRVLGQWNGGLSDSGEHLSLLDDVGNTLMSVDYGDSDPWAISADGAGATLVLVDSDTTPVHELGKYYHWRGSVEFGGTPGAASAAPQGVVINEVFAHSDPPQLDTIELLNPTDTTVDMGGWFLSDSKGNLFKYEIPAGTLLGAGQYITFDENDFNPTPATPGPNDFALNASDGDEVFLTIPDASATGVLSFVDQVDFGASLNGESFGRLPDGSGRLAPLLTTTFGSRNIAPRVGPIVVSEVNFHPEEPSSAALALEPTLVDNDLEFIEIHNPTATAVDLTDWRLRGSNDYDFVAGTTLAAGETSIVISFDPNDIANASRLAAFRAHYGVGTELRIVGDYDGHLSNGFSRVELQKPDDPPVSQPTFIPHITEDEVLYDDLAPWVVSADGQGDSLQRRDPGAYGNDATSWSGAEPSPGQVSFAPLLAGDYDHNGIVDQVDHQVWVSTFSSTVKLNADGNGDGIVDAADFTIWRDHLGSTSPLLVVAEHVASAPVSDSKPVPSSHANSLTLSEYLRENAARDHVVAVGPIDIGRSDRGDHKARARDFVFEEPTASAFGPARANRPGLSHRDFSLRRVVADKAFASLYGGESTTPTKWRLSCAFAERSPDEEVG